MTDLMSAALGGSACDHSQQAFGQGFAQFCVDSPDPESAAESRRHVPEATLLQLLIH